MLLIQVEYSRINYGISKLNVIYFAIALAEIGILFLLSKSISQVLSKFMSIGLLSFLFLPGVIIHELSHLMAAVILFVPVGNMDFTPKKNGRSLKLGSIEIARTDPIRRSIIGFAPIFLGLMLVIGVVYVFTSNILLFQSKNFVVFIFGILALAYFLFTVSNTMFSSSRDMEGTIEIIAALLIIVILLYFLGLRLPLSWILVFLESNIELVRNSTLFLLAPIIVDFTILGTIKIFTARSRSQI